MFICFILIDSVWKPDDLLGTKIFLQFCFDLLFRKFRISSLTEQTGFRCDHRSLSVCMDRTAFQHKRSRIIIVITSLFTKFFCNLIILLPVLIKAIIGSAPGIKAPVDSTDFFSIRHKGWSDIPCPCIVCRNC